MRSIAAACAARHSPRRRIPRVRGVARGRRAEFAPSREWLIERIAEVARPGDLVLVMGARDPSLTAFAHAVRARLEALPA